MNVFNNADAHLYTPHLNGLYFCIASSPSGCGSAAMGGYTYVVGGRHSAVEITIERNTKNDRLD